MEMKNYSFPDLSSQEYFFFVLMTITHSLVTSKYFIYTLHIYVCMYIYIYVFSGESWLGPAKRYTIRHCIFPLHPIPDQDLQLIF